MREAEPVAAGRPGGWTGGVVVRAALRAAWLLILPLLLAGLAVRYLIPDRWDDAGGWAWLARLGERYPVPLMLGFFLLFAVVVRRFADRLPVGSALVAGPVDTATPRSRRAAAWFAALVLAAAAAMVVRAAVGRVHRVSSASMLPTLEPSDYLLVRRAGRWRRSVAPPRRGDLVVFRGRAVGELGEELLVKRVIGLPGDRVSTSGGLASINGWQIPYCDVGRYIYYGQGEAIVGRLVVQFLEDRTFITLHTPLAAPFEGSPVPPGQVFVLGDNRNSSRDSRAWKGAGGVPLTALEGRGWRIIGHDRSGRVDLGRFLRAPDTQLHLPGMDTRALEARIARCLEKRPAVTWPPPPAHRT